MLDFISFLSGLSSNTELFIIVLLSIILAVNIFDWFFGWVNAKFNPNVLFESDIALYGIIKKMMYFIVLIMFSFISLVIIPHEISVPAIIVLYIGYLLSELNSILSHLELTNDGKEGEMFRTFLTKILKGGNKND